MKIAVVHSFYSSDQPSGENAMVEAQVNALRDANHSVSLISRCTDRFANRPTYKLRAAAAASGLTGPSPLPHIDSFGPDIVHIHNLFPNYGTKWTRKLNVPVVATMHNYRAICAAGTLFRDGHDCFECLSQGSHRSLINRCYRDSIPATAPLAWASRAKGTQNEALKRCTRLICLNPQATRIFADIYGEKRAVEIPNFVEYGTRKRVPSSERSGFVYVGRLSEEKGVSWLLANWPDSKQLTVAGTGPLGDLVNEVASARGNISVKGKLPHDDAMSLIANSQAVVVPSLWLEGLPTVALEAYALGTPILISERCGAAEELTITGAGVSFDPNRGASGLLKALSDVARDPGTRQAAALRLYSDRYSKARWLQSIVQCYADAISEFQ